MLSTQPARFSEQEIQRAIKHHRRALEALQDERTFEGIRYSTSKVLIDRLNEDLRRLEDELECRRTQLTSRPLAS